MRLGVGTIALGQRVLYPQLFHNADEECGYMCAVRFVIALRILVELYALLDKVTQERKAQ